MTRFKVKIVRQVFEILANFESTKAFCREYLTEEKPDFQLELSLGDIACEREKMPPEEKPKDGDFPDAFLETLLLQRKVTEALFDQDVLLFHGSVIAVDGKAYLFTATSGTGKSTHTRLWRELLGSRAVMVNDDKPYLSIGEAGVIAHGSPWNGKHGLGSNIAVPLKAICILERGIENGIRQIAPKEALLMLMQQSSRPMERGKLPRYLDLLDCLARNVRFYRLTCNLEPEAAALAYRVMAEEN